MLLYIPIENLLFDLAVPNIMYCSVLILYAYYDRTLYDCTILFFDRAVLSRSFYYIRVFCNEKNNGQCALPSSGEH